MNIFEALSFRLAENEAALIVSEENRKYLTSFSSSAGFLIISKNDTVFLTDSRYIEAARKTITTCEVRESARPELFLPELMKTLKTERLFLESKRTTVFEAVKFRTLLQETELVIDESLDDWLDSLRIIKTRAEVQKISAAQRIAERAFESALNFICSGITEKELALHLDFFMLKNGAEKVSFETIAVSGINSSMPHGVPSNKKIGRGDFITMDFGAVFEGYHSDMTRTVALGEVNDEQIRVYSTVLNAQLAALNELCEGLPCDEADENARAVICAEGYGEFFRHGTGHGVGIEIHEEPRLSALSGSVLQAGNVVTVEPGIYLPGKFGVRIEDMALILKNGHENLTKSPKDLIVIDK